jgi:hypothetical protein
MWKTSSLLLATLPLAACVSDSRREAVTLSVPPIAAPVAEDVPAGDPLGLQQAIARVRQQNQCRTPRR